MRIFYLFSTLLVGVVLFLGNSNGPGAVQGADRTGGPLADGFCGNCHAAGAFGPSIDVQMLQNGSTVTGYVPGQSYTLRVRINAAQGAQVYGFQAVALSGADNVQAGSFTAGAGNQVTPLNGRQYIEHSMRSTSNTFEVQWTAPATSVGEVRLYAAGVAANNAAGSGGDGATRLTSPLVLADLSVGTNELPELADDLTLWPNPAAEQAHIRFTLPSAGQVQLRVVNMAGVVVQEQQLRLSAGQQLLPLEIADLPAGQYWADLRTSEAASRVALIKQ